MAPTTRPGNRVTHTRSAFTLVEILIVVVILAVLASIVLPQFTVAADRARVNTLKSNLTTIRRQIQLYKQQHGTWPDGDRIAAQLTEPTTAEGDVVGPDDPQHRFGPYMTDIPPNPFTEDNEIANAAVGESDWYYDPTDGTFKANDSAEHREF